MQRLPAAKVAQPRHVQLFQLPSPVTNSFIEWSRQCWMCGARVPHLSVDVPLFAGSLWRILSVGSLMAGGVYN